MAKISISDFHQRVTGMRIEEVITAAHSVGIAALGLGHSPFLRLKLDFQHNLEVHGNRCHLSLFTQNALDVVQDGE
jgi:hypothetical protein